MATVIEFLSGLERYIGEAIFRVGAFYGALDAEITGRYTLGWLHDRCQRIDRELFERQNLTILATEVGALRAFVRGFGGKDVTVPDLPTWEEAGKQRQVEEPSVPDWWVEYKKANEGRVKL